MQGKIIKIIEKNGVKYRLLDYIEATGTQYFYSGINSSFKIKCELDIDITATGGQCGSDDLLTGLNQITETTGRYIARIGKSGTVVSKDAELGRHKIILDAPNNSFSIDGDVSAVTRGSTPVSTNFTILARRGLSGDSYQVTGKLYGCKIWEDGELKREYIPVEKMDGTVGMLDLVSGNFYGNNGTGTFVKGNYITVNHIYRPSKKHMAKTYELLDSIEATGTQYIDTGITDYSNLRVSFDVALTNLNMAFNMGVLQGSSPYQRFHVSKQTASNYFQAGLRNYIDTNQQIVAGTDWHYIALNAATNNFLVDTRHITLTNTGSLPTLPFYVFGRNRGSGTPDYCYCKIKTVNFMRGDEVILNLVPAKRLIDNVIGMVDTLTNTFYQNSGTGKFIGRSKETPTYIEEEVTEVEYIQSDGNERVNTISVLGENEQIEAKWSVDAVTSGAYSAMFGADNESIVTDRIELQIIKSGKKVVYWVGSSYYGQFTAELEHIYESIIRKDKIYTKDLTTGTTINDLTIHSGFKGGDNQITLFGPNGGDSDRGIGKIYYFRRRGEDGEIIKNFIPVKYNNQYVFLDLVSGKFAVSSGTGSLTGNDRTEVKKIMKTVIANNVKYYPLSYIESSGAQYINTGIKPSGAKVFETTVSFTDITTANAENGAYRLNQRFHYGVRPTKSSFYAGMGTAYYDGTAFTLDTNKHTHTMDVPQRRYYKDIGTASEQYYNLASGTIPTDLDVYLLARNDEGTASGLCKAKLFSHKVWDGGELIQDLIPCERASDNVLGMLDLVSGTFYTNAGTGTFTGGRKEIILVE